MVIIKNTMEKKKWSELTEEEVGQLCDSRKELLMKNYYFILTGAKELKKKALFASNEDFSYSLMATLTALDAAGIIEIK